MGLDETFDSAGPCAALRRGYGQCKGTLKCCDSNGVLRWLIGTALPHNIVKLNFSIQCRPTDVQQLGRLGNVAISTLESFDD